MIAVTITSSGLPVIPGGSNIVALRNGKVLQIRYSIQKTQLLIARMIIS